MAGYLGSKRSSSLVSTKGITLEEVKLAASGDSITKSDGTTAVLSESGGVVTLTADAAIIEGSSSGDLVRITQTGSGNALVVEDSANPDSSPFVVTSSGDVIVGKTSTAIEDVGLSILSTGRLIGTADSDDVLVLRRNTTDGDIISFRKDNAIVGSIGTYDAGYLYIASTRTTDAGFKLGSSWILPCTTSGADRDNAIDLGKTNVRWNEIYLQNGPINGSDKNEKQDIEELTEAEQRVAVAAKSLMRKFRWKNAVAEKGDEARIHFGIIAQDLQAAFEAEGLDAGRYAMFISTTWWETFETYTDDEGIEQTRTNTYDTAEEAPENAVERTRLGVRYSELLAFIIAAI